ncbi:MAG: N-formylglutamate deformylase [Frankiales bacterium]|nr:N-formylglutamate deformylase [Frankiales bacterium]
MSRTEVRLSDAELSSWEGLLPPWPGAQEDGVFVRRTPATGAEPALFVHGLGGASTNWTDLMGLLAGHVDGAALDLPGFGWSEPPASSSYALRTHVRAVIALLEHQDLGPVHLFGNSLGGAVSTRVAARRPDLVRTLTLVSPALPSLRPRRGMDPRMPLLLLPGISTLLSRRLAETTPEQRAAAVIDLCFGDPSAVPEERRREAVEEVTRRSQVAHGEIAFTGSLRGLIGAWLERGQRNLWRQATTVRVPTLLVWGTEDRLVDVSLAPKALAAFPASRLLVLPGVGHVAQLEDPETVARAFLALCEDSDAQRARA